MSVSKKYKDIEGMVKIEEVGGEELVKKFAEEMEEMLGRKMKSVKVIMTHSVTANAHFNGNCTWVLLQTWPCLNKEQINADLITTLGLVCVILDLIMFLMWAIIWADCMLDLLYFITEVSRSSRGC